jgi:hypothetical protein
VAISPKLNRKMSEKKNQHYIPKFYLRNFSYQSNEKQIGLFNIFNQIFCEKAKLKAQGSKNFFYGKDGKIEDSLCVMEGVFALRIREIIETLKLPKKNSIEHFELLSFIAVTDLRNPVHIEGTKNMMKEMERRLIQLDDNVEKDNLMPSLLHDEIVEMSLSLILDVTSIIYDLEYKLLINETQKPFISSDFPVIKYNQFLENKNWKFSKTGFAMMGLQIFVPLNHKITLVFYDSAVYKLGDRKQTCIFLKDIESINELNKLQFVNCFGNLYFDEKASENYIRELFESSKKFKRANQSKSELSYVIHDGEDEKEIISGNQNLIIMNSSDCETKLKVSELKIHSNGKALKLKPNMGQYRKHPEKIMNERNNH